ncbi:MAG: BMP family ABC transporter substrate-binding protein [Thermomicrobiales bacterium]|nr:BMP family ABC transporter substrate-binding protein [Thermomicrobiales bacterium]
MNRVRRPFRILGVLTLLAAFGMGFIVPALAQDASPEPTISTAALITPSARTNLGWDQQGADGLDAAAAATGITAIVAENGGYDDITPALADLADEGAQLIICHASGYQTTCPDFAAQNEGVSVAVIENPDAVSERVADIETQAQEVAYLAGVLAGLTTTTGTVGVVVSGEPPTWNYLTVGFAEGLNASNPDAKLIYSVIGEAAYDDAAGAKRVTEQQLANGADIIFGMGDGASFGMIEAIREYNEANAETPAWFIDVIGDKSADYSDVLLTSVLFDYSGIYEEMIRNAGTDQFGQVYTMNVENGGVRLLDLPESVPAETADAVAAAQASIIDGSVTVSAVGDSEGMHAKLAELGYE